MNYVGIDWADDKHDICILRQDGTLVSEHTIAHTSTGLAELHDILAGLEEMRINIERPDGLLVSGLLGEGYPLYVTAPTHVASRRSRPDKNDREDARLLANLLRTGDDKCRLLRVNSAAQRTLKPVVRAYDQLQQHQLRVSNQLRDVLKQYYPVMLGLFSRLHQPLTLAFLRAFPTPQAARTASRQELVEFFASQSYRWMEKVGDKYEHLQAPALTEPVSEGLVIQMLSLVGVLETLSVELKKLERHMRQLLHAHPEGDWWLSLPGVGIKTAARLLAYIGDNRDRFPTVQSLQVYAGTVPVTVSSGKRRRVSFRYNCNHALRNAAIDLAAHSRAKSGWARAYYLEQRARGHDHQRALRALANRWLKIIWTIWQRREAYQEAKHVSNRARRGVVSFAQVA